MCGIAGFIGLQQEPRQLLEAMLQHLAPRGPDDQGMEVLAEGVALGMRRLAVIDIEGGRQPLQDERTGVTLVYNGELYNFQALRMELQNEGHIFRTDCDTEVVLVAYLEWGCQFVERLNGMFAIALWDPRLKELVLVRDHFGQKPLYIWQTDNQLAFASDLRSLMVYPAIKKSLNDEALVHFLRYRHISSEHSIVKEVKQLSPGHYAIFKLNGGYQERRYWQPRFSVDDALDGQTALEKFNDIWASALKRSLVSDVNLGAFLSGGIDSSLIVAVASQFVSNLKTFSISFPGSPFDETRYAVEVARIFGTQHEVIPFEASLESCLSDMTKAFDQPFSDPAALPSLMLCRDARKQITVALTGDGGDELFGGYQRYISAQLGRKLLMIPKPVRSLINGRIKTFSRLLSVNSGLRRTLDAVTRRVDMVSNNFATEYKSQFQLFDNELLAQLLEVPIPLESHSLESEELLEAMLIDDLENWLPDQMLVKMDRCSMANSLEVRLPFLDLEVVELALSLPADLRVRGRETKVLLRKVAAEHLPKSITDRPKHGFAVPVDSWLRSEANFVTSRLEAEMDQGDLPLNPTVVRQLWQEHRECKYNHGDKILALLTLFSWRRSNYGHSSA